MAQLDLIPPGEVLLEDFLKPYGITQEQLDPHSLCSS
jgi:plasmid maintenance system antidote protein VapI